mgnify:CR=1 FL=1
MIYSTPKYPNQIRLDTTTACNAKCLSCHRNTLAARERKGKMDINYAVDIIKDIASWDRPLSELVPVNYGEVFLYPDWFNLLVLVERLLPQTVIVIPTNGSLLSQESVACLARIKTVKILNLSVNALYQETYEQFTGLSFDNYTRLRRIVDYLHFHRPDIEIVASMVFDPAYQTDLERGEFYLYWKQLVNHVVCLPAANCNRHEQIIKPIQPCRSIFSDLAIGYDGKLSACCFEAGFTMDLGEYKGSVLEAWRNPKLEQLRELHNTGKRQEVLQCSKCSFA